MSKLDTEILEKLYQRMDTFCERLESGLGLVSQADNTDWSQPAYRWIKRHAQGVFAPIKQLPAIELADLLGIEQQKQLLTQNTRQFVAGLPCNNALLWGARGTGKSSLIKALLNEFSPQGLKVVEVEGHDLIDLPEIVEPLAEQSQRFVIFTDDLSFSADDPSYRALKAILDGSVAESPKNVVIYATSNRRHLMPEFMRDNMDANSVNGEIHHGEGVEEKISLSERFGIWLSFHPFKQEEYLQIVEHWLGRLSPGLELNTETQAEALRWALQRGSRSGRVARQFAADWVGQQQLRTKS